MFRSGHLLAIPMNTEHGISKIEEGPVRAILVHFT
jgi:quercetin dioxygenase-like cupin family protein